MLAGVHDRTAKLGASLHGMNERGDLHKVWPSPTDVKYCLLRHLPNAELVDRFRIATDIRESFSSD